MPPEMICPDCGREYRPDVEYCTRCGARLLPVPAELIVVRRCENSPMHAVIPGDKFCGKCGGRVVEVEEERPKIVLHRSDDPRVTG